MKKMTQTPPRSKQEVLAAKAEGLKKLSKPGKANFCWKVPTAKSKHRRRIRKHPSVAT